MNWSFLKRKPEPLQPPNLFREMELGAQATQLLESDAFQGAMQKVREGIHSAWAKAPVRDIDGQHELRLMLKVVDDLESHLITESQTGKMAAMQINAEGRKAA